MQAGQSSALTLWVAEGAPAGRLRLESTLRGRSSPLHNDLYRRYFCGTGTNRFKNPKTIDRYFTGTPGYGSYDLVAGSSSTGRGTQVECATTCNTVQLPHAICVHNIFVCPRLGHPRWLHLGIHQHIELRSNLARSQSIRRTSIRWISRGSTLGLVGTSSQKINAGDEISCFQTRSLDLPDFTGSATPQSCYKKTRTRKRQTRHESRVVKATLRVTVHLSTPGWPIERHLPAFLGRLHCIALLKRPDLRCAGSCLVRGCLANWKVYGL